MPAVHSASHSGDSAQKKGGDLAITALHAQPDGRAYLTPDLRSGLLAFVPRIRLRAEALRRDTRDYSPSSRVNASSGSTKYSISRSSSSSSGVGGGGGGGSSAGIRTCR